MGSSFKKVFLIMNFLGEVAILKKVFLKIYFLRVLFERSILKKKISKSIFWGRNLKKNVLVNVYFEGAALIFFCCCCWCCLREHFWKGISENLFFKGSNFENVFFEGTIFKKSFWKCIFDRAILKMYFLKVRQCRFENLSISLSSYENNMSKILH